MPNSSDFKRERVDEDELPSDAYAEDTPLTWILEDSKTEIVAALLSEHDRSLNKADIARIAGVSSSTVTHHIDDLVKYGVVENGENIGPSQMYRINKESKAAKLLGQLEEHLLDVHYEEVWEEPS